jgi:cobalamin biosynthesis protein CobD/CbiB
MHYLGEIKKWLGEITEIFLLLIALGVVVEILFGSPDQPVPFFGGIVKNLTNLIGTLGQSGLVGLIALGIIVYLFQRRGVFAQQH